MPSYGGMEIVMEVFFISMLSVFSVIGIITVFKEWIYEKLNPKEIVLYTLNDEDKIEYLIRSLKNQYPNTVIKIKDNGSNDCTMEIAGKLGVLIEDKED